MEPPIVVGCGAGFSADRLDPARALAESGRVGYLVLECVGERTFAQGHRNRMLDPAAGFNRYLDPQLRALLRICRRSGTRIIANTGAANPVVAAEKARGVAQDLGISGLQIAFILGDEVTDSEDIRVHLVFASTECEQVDIAMWEVE
jgi:hypothetical protein